jgi:hypothetical protein
MVQHATMQEVVFSMWSVPLNNTVLFSVRGPCGGYIKRVRVYLMQFSAGESTRSSTEHILSEL